MRRGGGVWRRCSTRSDPSLLFPCLFVLFCHFSLPFHASLVLYQQCFRVDGPFEGKSWSLETGSESRSRRQSIISFTKLHTPPCHIVVDSSPAPYAVSQCHASSTLHATYAISHTIAHVRFVQSSTHHLPCQSRHLNPPASSHARPSRSSCREWTRPCRRTRWQQA